MTSRVLRAATVGLFLGVMCAGCGTSNPSVPVPADCQAFLTKFFAALKAKDVAKIQEMVSIISFMESGNLPGKSDATMHEATKKMTADIFARMTKDVGDFKSYSVAGVKVTTIATNDFPAANMMGAGIHAEIMCKARFTKKRSVQIGFHLFKKTEESEYLALAWKYQAPR